MAYSGFKEYMQVKRRKLEVQAYEVASSLKLSDALAGTILYFDGYLGETNLSMLQFKELVLTHGAMVRDKLEGECTHIIATQMTDKKMKEWRKPVVRPEWLEDSIKAGKLLPWIRYRLYTNLIPSQSTMTNFVSRSSQSNQHTQNTEYFTPASIPATPPSTKFTIIDEPSPLNTPKNFTTHDEDYPISDSPSDSSDTDSPAPDPYQPEEEEEEEEGVHPWLGPGPRIKVDPSSQWYKDNICTAPGFMKKYFSSSRLHHLSIWKSDLRDFVAARMKPKPKSSSTTETRTIMHVDMDCFFASVALRSHPHLRTVPVAIAHSTNTSQAARSTAEIASCNYPARDLGVRNGMSIGRARTLAPNLHVLPYEFSEYDTCSKALYEVLMKYADVVQVGSLDEAFVDVSTPVSKIGAIELAEKIRREIFEVTKGCPASIGIGSNMLLARVATKKAKPDGVYHITDDDAHAFLEELGVGELPGVGWVLADKLAKNGIKTCGDLMQYSIGALKTEYGDKTGETLWQFCRGIDARQLENKGRKSIGAECNWGVRMQTEEDVRRFVGELCEEVARRMKSAGVAGGRLVTLKVKRRRYEGEPPKVLGCGDCDNLSRSASIGGGGALSLSVLTRECLGLLRDLRVQADYIRGMGVHVSRLSGGEVVSASQKTLNFTTKRVASGTPPPSKPAMNQHREPPRTPPQRPTAAPPYEIAYEDIDQSVLAELPEEIRKQYMAPPPPPLSSSPAKPALTRIPSFHKSQYLPTISQVDPEVFNNLPPHIRNEQTAAMKTSNKRPDPPPPTKATTFHMSQYIPTASQVSLEVLKELPEEVRREIEVAMRNRGAILAGVGGSRSGSVSGSGKGGVGRSPKKRKRVEKGQGPVVALWGRMGGAGAGGSGSGTDLHIVERNETHRPIIPPKPTLGNTSDIEQIERMLDEWVERYRDGPEKEDVDALEKYLEAMVEEMELEGAQRVLG
ncbi:deoxycytidyl transferase, partial [Rhizophlyctis rosea]